MRPPVEELYLWRELRVEFSWQAGTLAQQQARLREACSLRGQGFLRSCDGCSREELARVLQLPARKLPAILWQPPLELPAPEQVAAQLPPVPLRVGVAAAHVAVVRGDGAWTTTRPLAVDARNQAGETFTWLYGGPAPPLTPAQVGRKAPPSGPMAVLLAPQPAAVLVHELFGHPLEADSFFSGQSPWTGHLGRRLFSLPLQVVDDPTQPSPGSFLLDDEGEPARRKALVEEGVLRQLLADRSFSRPFSLASGNARRPSPHHPPTPRLANLLSWVEGGPSEPPREEARVEVTRVRSGVFLPSSGELLLAVSESYQLWRGQRVSRLAPFFLHLTLSLGCPQLAAGGGVPEPVAEPGWCVKDHQPLPVGASASWLLLVGVEAA